VPDLAFALSLASVLPHEFGPYVGLVLAGFVVGILGHLSTSRWLVVIGIGMIVLGALLFPLALNLTEGTPPEVQNAR
jgi:hypothetical protein